MAQSIGELIAQNQGVGVPTAASAAQDPPVYVGFHGEHEAQGPGTLPASSVLAQFYQWDDTERAQWGKRLYTAGLIKDPNDWDGQLAGWKAAVQGASDYYVSAGKHITPWGFMDLKQEQAAGPPQPHTSTSTSVNLPSKSDAAAAIQAMFKNELGREATDGEIDRYSSMMLAQYRKNPNKTVTTSTTNADGTNTTSNSLQSGGFNPQGWLEDQAQADPEYGAYQASTTYFNALQQAIGAGANLA